LNKTLQPGWPFLSNTVNLIVCKTTSLE
jgi:hypothetical protein